LPETLLNVVYRASELKRNIHIGRQAISYEVSLATQVLRHVDS